MLAVGDAGSLAWARGIGADLLVQPRLTLERDAWTLRVLVIDPERADVLDELATRVSGDRKAGPRALPQDRFVGELGDRLTRDAAKLAEMRRATPVGVLFFGNTTASNDRMDPFADELADAIHGSERPGLRMLRFPAVQASRGEQELALGGLTEGPHRWQDLAKWWVWGEFRETDWEGRAPAEAGLEVRVTVWDGAHEPVQVRERGTVGRRAALARAVAERVAAIAGAGAPGKPLPPPQLAARLVEQAAALDAENIGGEWGASAAWLNRWRQAHRLLDLARFVAPDDRTAALGWVRSRFREDLAKSAGASAGTKYYDEPEHLWQVRRADAWGRFVDRFGLGGDWPHLWPQRPNIADNRTATNTVASMYLRSAVEVLGAIPNSDWDRGRSHWPISGKPLAALLDAWTQETLRRALIVADAKLAPAGALATEAAELRRVLRHDDKAMDLLNARLPSPPVTVMPPTPATARATAPQPARVATTAGAKTVGATAAGAATRAPAQPKNSPAVRASAGIDLTDRYHVSVAAVAAWQDAWLVAANGQDLGTANLDMGNFLFLRTAKDGDKFRRIEKSLNLQAGVAAVAQQGPVVWIAGSGDGIVQIDLATVKWKRWGLKSGLPVETFADIDMDRNRGPVAVSGESVSPPVIALRQNEQWTGHTVETFRTNPQEKPYGKRVAATRGAVLVCGDEHGAAPFASLWPRDKRRWMDVRTPLLRHLEENNLDVRGVPFGKERFNVLDAVALPAGGFVLLHSLGASWITDAGALLRTTPWPERRRAAEIGQALLSQDASRLWIAANAEPGAGVVIELPLSAGVPPTFHALPGVSRPLRLAQNEDQLLVGGVSSGPHVIFLRLRDGSIER